MSADSEELDMFDPRPFWFVPAELLAEMWHDEINLVIQLFAKHPDMRQLLDAPDVTIPRRKICFELLAHRKVIEMIDDTALGRYADLPALSQAESQAIKDSQGLVTSDAPAWVLEMNEVAEWLPVHINRALPEPLREQGFYRNDPAKDEAVRSAAGALNTLEQIQALTARVIVEQLQRLKDRWSAAAGRSKKSKHWLKGFDGLGPKVTDLSEYMLGLTERQYMAFSLKNEFELQLSEIAARMGLNRKTAYEHLNAANRRIEHGISDNKSKALGAKRTPE